jgi:hypothetical protein
VPSRAKPGSNKDDSLTIFLTQNELRSASFPKIHNWIERTWEFILRPLGPVFRPLPCSILSHGQQFIRSHNETLSVVAVRVSNEDRLPARIHGCNAAPTPTGFAQIVSDDFPVLYTRRIPARLLY